MSTITALVDASRETEVGVEIKVCINTTVETITGVSRVALASEGGKINVEKGTRSSVASAGHGSDNAIDTSNESSRKAGSAGIATA